MGVFLWARYPCMVHTTDTARFWTWLSFQVNVLETFWVGPSSTPESKKGSPTVKFPSRQWFSKVETGTGACFK